MADYEVADINLAERGQNKIDWAWQYMPSLQFLYSKYRNSQPFKGAPSYLILGKRDEKIIHVVASINEDIIYIVTAYVPSGLKWENDYKTRKDESK